MGAALECLTGFIANVAALTTPTMNGSDSLTVRFTDPAKKIWLLNAWELTEGANGLMEIRSPKLHDNVHGIRVRVPTASPNVLLNEFMPQRLYPQDNLSWQFGGGTGAGAIQPAALMLYYEDLPGIAARFIDSKTLAARMVNVFTVETAITLAATGAYSTPVAINATFDLFKANTDYALMGFLVDNGNAGGVFWRGADSGNLRVGGPALAAIIHVTADWFVRLANQTGIPLIPVFNSAAKAGIFVDAVANHNGGTLNLVSIMAELAPKPVGT
jgi:hypothetical protein